MVWFRKKKKLRLRTCRTRTSPDCEIFFKSEHRRPKACNNCKDYERRNKIMGLPKETIEWKNSNEGEILVREERELKNEKGQIIGTKLDETRARVTVEDIEHGIKVVKERLEQNAKKVKGIKEELLKKGKKPTITPELQKLKKHLLLLQEHDTIVNLEKKLTPLEEQLNTDELFIKNRTTLLSTRPQ